MSLAAWNEIGDGLGFGRASMRLGYLLSTCSVEENTDHGFGGDLTMFARTRRHECVLFVGCSDLAPHKECGI